MERFPRVLDLGAGDARFSRAVDAYDSYTGIEFDPAKAHSVTLPEKAKLIEADAMAWVDQGFSLCIGNPPYIRYHGLEVKWREKALQTLEDATGVQLKRSANAFVMFLLRALQLTADDGLVVQLIPFEWVTRPSAKELRDHIKTNGWATTVYRFDCEIFPRVLTTASITIIDKRRKDPVWKFGIIGKGGQVRSIAEPSGSSEAVLAYAKRAEDIYGLRGLSPGGQDIFVLTEEERLQFALRKTRDVTPCVTTLRHLGQDLAVLDAEAFNRLYVAAGKRCWLIRSDKDVLSEPLQAYLKAVGNRWRAYSTCTERSVWWRYKPHPAPEMLFSSGFVGSGTKVLVNKVRAIAAGSVYGVISTGARSVDKIADELRGYDFAKRVVSHSNNLKKVEVRQLNAVLAEIA
ncbi:hypothetical protein ASD35_20240 [Pelomonas sp. Root1444]|nr:hypothetical protein ASD35_20240 [Pelomonas sp. Root1444]